jgi:hypothetical protein
MIRWGYVWAGMMFLTSAVNAAVALTVSFAAWSAFIAVFPIVSKAGLFAVQYVTIRAQAIRNQRRSEARAAAQAQGLPIAA